MSKKLKGIAKFINIGTGFWGIIDHKGKEWLPVNMPEQLKEDGQEVECRVIPFEGDTMHMWGDPVQVISFKTIS